MILEEVRPRSPFLEVGLHNVSDDTNPSQLTILDILRWRTWHETLREAYTFLM